MTGQVAGQVAEQPAGQPAGRVAHGEFAPSWLALREPADAAARSTELAAALGELLPADRPLIIHDLGSGTGSMPRWLAPLLPGPQHWVLHDRDPVLLEHAAGDRYGPALDGTPVTVEVRPGDLTTLHADELAGTAVVTASALLDVLTRGELAGLAATCAALRCRVLLALTVLGEVRLTPPEPLDLLVEEAFNAHQRRTVAGRGLLGPDALGVAREAFAALGGSVDVRQSPWRLGTDERSLTRTWLVGRLDAAAEQLAEQLAAEQPTSASADPADPAEDWAEYRARRLDQADSGNLGALVRHADLLAWW